MCCFTTFEFGGVRGGELGGCGGEVVAGMGVVAEAEGGERETGGDGLG